MGPNSGDPLITTPVNFGSVRLVGGAMELSNVDLSQEFINMILASTGYSAASRVITTTDDLIDQLLILGREGTARGARERSMTRSAWPEGDPA